MFDLALEVIKHEKSGSDTYDLVNKTIDFLIKKNGRRSREEYLPIVQEEIIKWINLPLTYTEKVVLNCINKNINDLAEFFYETKNNKSQHKDWYDARDCIARCIAETIIKTK